MSRCSAALLVLVVCLLGASCAADLAARAARAAITPPPAGAPGATAAAITPLPAPADTRDADAQIKHWKVVADQAARDRDAAADRERQANGEVARLVKVRDALRLEAWRDRLAWAAGVALLGILAGVALEFILPAGLRGWATTGIMACIGLAIAAWTLRAVIPWLPLVARWGACALSVGTVGYALWRLRQAILAARHAADHGDRMEAALLGIRDWFTGDESLLHELVASVKGDSAKAQAAAGIGAVLAHIRGADPAQSAHVASLPALRAKVAELPAPRPVEPMPHDAPATAAVALTPIAAPPVVDLAEAIAANTTAPRG